MISLVYNLSSLIAGNSVLPAIILLFVIVDVVLLEAFRSYFFDSN